MMEEPISVERLMRVVDHTLLKPFATEENVRNLIDEAAGLRTFSVCINPIFLGLAKQYIASKRFDLKVAVVVDFPFGAGTTEARVLAIREYSKMADELDVVVPVGFVKSRRFDLVRVDIENIVVEAHRNKRVIKIIVEDAYTTLDEKRELYKIVMESGADFIKTSTGFEDREYAASIGNNVGARVENVKLMAELSEKYNPEIGIKVSGGVRTYAQALELLRASRRELDPKRFRIGASGTRRIYESASYS